MASAYFGLNRGQTEFQVTESGTTSGSTDIEIRIDLTKGLQKSEMLQLIEMIENHILKNQSKFLVD
jgi:hypothetical protein